MAAALFSVDGEPGVLHVNRRCKVTTADGVVVVVVDGAAWMSFDELDIAGRRVAMVQLAERSVGTQEQIAAAFGYKPLSLIRFLRDFRAHGVAGLLPKRRGAPEGPRVTGGKVDQVILASKRAGQSENAIAAKLGISRPSVRSALIRLKFKAESVQDELIAVGQRDVTPAAGALESEPDPEALLASESKVEQSDQVESAESSSGAPVHEQVSPTAIAAVFSADSDPSNRSLDRLLAREGCLEDAAPLFENADGIRDVGALLAIPVLTQQGVFYEALQVFDGIGPAFYGLRTTVVCLCLMMMLNLSRLQDIMQREPRSVGKLVGLDRSPEVKTLRRKLMTLAGQGRSLVLMDALARRSLEHTDSDNTWVYLDGHVSVYSGKHKLREHHVASLRAARPSVMDYWVNQPNGDPLLVVTGAPKEGLVGQIQEVLDKVRELAPNRPVTVVFDREGWSPRLFAQVKSTAGVHFLTYRKARPGERIARLPEALFKHHTIEVDGREVTYVLADTRVRIPYWEGKVCKQVELRQITRRKADGKQTCILTDDDQREAAQLAHRMFGRWSQENYFKYAGEHRDLDALVTQEMDPVDGTRLVPNPERAAPKAQLATLHVQLRKVHEDYGRKQLDSDSTPIILDSEHIARVNAIEEDIARAQAKFDALPATVPWNATDKGRNAAQPNIEMRRLMHVFRIASHRAESALLELLRPHFADWRHEGRTLVRTILHCSGSLHVTDTALHVTLEPLASPYKSRALSALCDEVTRLDCTFPGSNLKMVFSVRDAPQVS